MSKIDPESFSSFLEKYVSSAEDAVYLTVSDKRFLRLIYWKNMLFNVALVAENTKTAPGIGKQLYFRPEIDSSEEKFASITFKTQNGHSGIQWIYDSIYYGNVHGMEPEKIKKISCNEWVDECIQEMIKESDE